MKPEWMDKIAPLLPEDARRALEGCTDPDVTEIRLRLNKPMELVSGEESKLLYAPNGRGMLEEEETRPLLQRFCDNALYAWEKEIQKGFVTLKNGCRVGISGKAVPETGALSKITGFSIRIVRSVRGCGEKLLPYLLDEQGRFLSTLLVSPPGCGKTTLLRDLIRLLSDGLCGSRCHRVSLVDERFEVSGGEGGSFDLGSRTDVLLGAGKAEGLLRMLSTMSPQVLSADELNFLSDVKAVLEAKSRGVAVLCTAHGADLKGLLGREGMACLYKEQVFERYVILEGVGGIKEIRTGMGEKL